MADFHHVVINNVCKVICWKSVRLKQNWIWRNIFVLPFNVAQNVVVEYSCTFHWNLKADYVWFSCSKISLNFFFCKVTAVAVVSRSHLVFSLDFADTVKSFCITETVISFAVFNKLLSIFLVKLKTFTLNVRTKITAL